MTGALLCSERCLFQSWEVYNSAEALHLSDHQKKYGTSMTTETGVVWQEVWDKVMQTGAKQRRGAPSPLIKPKDQAL